MKTPDFGYLLERKARSSSFDDDEKQCRRPKGRVVQVAIALGQHRQRAFKANGQDDSIT